MILAGIDEMARKLTVNGYGRALQGCANRSGH